MRTLAMLVIVTLCSCGAVPLAATTSVARVTSGGQASACGLEQPCSGGGSASTTRWVGVLGVATIVSLTAMIAQLRR